MTKREIYDCIMNTVCRMCDVSVDDVVHGVKRSDCVEARSIAAHFLTYYGIFPTDVVKFSGYIIKHRYCVSKSASMYHGRYDSSFSFRCMSDSIGNILKEILQRKANEVKT